MSLRLSATAAALALCALATPAAANGAKPVYEHPPGGYGHAAPAACQHRIVVPDRYEIVADKVLVSPGWCRRQYVPPIYGFVRQPVAVEAERWQRTVVTPAPALAPHRHGHGWHGLKHKHGHGVQVLLPPAPVHLVERRKPSVVRYRSQRVLLAPARMEEVCAPPVYAWVERKILVAPSHWDWRLRPGC